MSSLRRTERILISLATDPAEVADIEREFRNIRMLRRVELYLWGALAMIGTWMVVMWATLASV